MHITYNVSCDIAQDIASRSSHSAAVSADVSSHRNLSIGVGKFIGDLGASSANQAVHYLAHIVRSITPQTTSH